MGTTLDGGGGERGDNAMLAAAELLPPTGMISGRAGNPASHYWYRIGAAARVSCP